jgi:soluble lytic murein transglycosylase-like protein
MHFPPGSLDETRPTTPVDLSMLQPTRPMLPTINWRRHWTLVIPIWLIFSLVLTLTLPTLLELTFGTVAQPLTGTTNWLTAKLIGASPRSIAPLFTPEVDYWADDISRWSRVYSIDHNLLATVMQIESCGHDSVASVAGAQGLFQVMPFHFEDDEIQTDPETNVRRGAQVLNDCMIFANGDPGLAMACYNGGPSVTQKSFQAWQPETQRYYTWGLGIYADAINNAAYSDTLASWLAAGGSLLCEQAATIQRNGKR